MKDKMTTLEVPPVGEYLQMLVDAGAKPYARKMSLDMFGYKKEDFFDGVIDIFTAGDFTDLPEGAQVLFIESSSRLDGRTWFYFTSLLTHGFPLRRL